MNITVERSALLNMLGHIQGVVEKRGTIPILSNVLLSAGNGTLTLNATDMDVEVSEIVKAEIATGGSTTAPAHMLYEIVRKLPEGSQVSLDSESIAGQMVVKSGRSNFKLSTLPVEDFPRSMQSDFTHSFSISAADLRDIIDRTKFAVSADETRYYLNGVYLHAFKKKGAEKGQTVLRAVATDGHRLAMVDMPIPEGAAGMPGVIISRKTVTEISKLLSEFSDQVNVDLSNNKIRFKIGNVSLTSKLIDGTFPDYERVIPFENEYKMILSPVALSAAVDRVSSVSMDKLRTIKMAVDGQGLVLNATGQDVGSATEELEVKYDGKPVEIGFNARYLLDIMGQIDGEGVSFAFSDSASPVLIRDVADNTALYVLMPMRL